MVGFEQTQLEDPAQSFLLTLLWRFCLYTGFVTAINRYFAIGSDIEEARDLCWFLEWIVGDIMI